jgi:hypothetical protein
MSPNWLLPFGFSDQNSVWISYFPHTCYMSRKSILLISIVLKRSGEEYKLWSFSFCCLLLFHFLPHLFDSRMFLSTLFSYTFNFSSSLTMRDEHKIFLWRPCKKRPCWRMTCRWEF